MFLTAIIEPTGPIAVPMLVDELLDSAYRAHLGSQMDSAYQAHLFDSTQSAAGTPQLTDRLDNTLPFDALAPLLPAPHPASWTAAQLADLAMPVAFVLMALAMLIIVCLFAMKVESRHQELRQRVSEAEQRENDLRAKQAELRALLFERDRLMSEYQLMRRAGFTDAQYEAWDKKTWKIFSRNYLRLLAWARALCYTDYRERIIILSPTYGQKLPTLEALKAQTKWVNYAPLPEAITFPADVLADYLRSNTTITNAGELYDFLDDVSPPIASAVNYFSQHDSPPQKESVETVADFLAEFSEPISEPLPLVERNGRGALFTRALPNESPYCTWPDEAAAASFAASGTIQEASNAISIRLRDMENDSAAEIDNLFKAAGLD